MRIYLHIYVAAHNIVCVYVRSVINRQCSVQSLLYFMTKTEESLSHLTKLSVIQHLFNDVFLSIINKS